jgi:nicotinate-nucleotide adenylyltransferase
MRQTERAVARTGILGGTFNPIHIAHLRAAEEVAEQLGLEKMVFIPSARPPHKDAEDDDPIAPAADRLAWVKRAVADNPLFEVDTLEIERQGPSYLVDTLQAIRTRTAPELPVFVLGADAFREIGSWREPATLLSLAHFAVATRPPLGAQPLSEWLAPSLAAPFEMAADGRSGQHREAGTWIQLVEITALDISASDVRAAIRAGRSVRYVLPESIHDAVLASGCYNRRGQDPGLDSHNGTSEVKRS